MNRMTNLVDYSETLASLLTQTEITNGYETQITHEAAEEETMALLDQVKLSGNKVLLVGNGGSAAIVAHAQNDLCKANGIRSLVLHEPSLLTALTNDDGYEVAFQKQVELWGEPGDMLIAVSSSGRSENILRACGAAQSNGIFILTCSGFDPDNTLRQLGEINYYVPSHSYGMVELAHSVITHYITDRCAGLLPKELPSKIGVKR